jgi:trehalose/maltose hydrolase-like predicted phosphorylase
VLDRTFDAVVFDWDGTAVPDRAADAPRARSLVEALCAAGVHVVVVSGTHVGNVDGQLAARPAGPGRLHLCLNRGSEVFEVTAEGATLVYRRAATGIEDAALDRAAAVTVEQLAGRGLRASIVSERLNRRKIDVIPEPAWADPPKARIAELLDAVNGELAAAGIADLAEVVAIAVAAARTSGVTDPRVTSDVKHVEIGLTDKTDSGRWAAAWLQSRGITGGLVLIAGDEFGPVGGVPGSDSLMMVPELERAVVVSVGAEPGGVPGGVHHLGGGPARFLDILDEQLARRRDRRVPGIDDDPAWAVPLPAGAHQERVAEALGVVGNGWASTRAAREEDAASATPLFVVNGVYTNDPLPRLLEGPLWTSLAVTGGGLDGRRLDLRTGVLYRADPDSMLRSVRFVSAADPHGLALRAEASPAVLGVGETFAPGGRHPIEREDRDDVRLARTSTPDGGGIVVAGRDHMATTGDVRTIERVAAWAADPAKAPDWDDAVRALGDVERLGFDGLLAEHREAWAHRWADADVTIDGGDDDDDGVLADQLAARFAVFQLLNVAPDAGVAAVGARGLTGDGYGGHVFWDADVFVLPALAAIRPEAARAMLAYRVHGLPAARAAAAALGLPGARFPWEAAASGTDVTPKQVTGLSGEVVPINTGQREEHITADVAWATGEYAAWSGDGEFLAGPGRDLVVETARYWAGHIRSDAAGRGHLCGLMGPDEYHELVDDNTYTNVMVRSNLKRAADLVEQNASGDHAEARVWRDLADGLVDGWDAARRLYEQFAGYWQLEPLIAEHIAPRPFAADMVLGAERVAGSQLIKQPDVLMLHHLVPDEVEPDSLAANLAFYEPRTTFGSSLSPAIYAALFARAGQPDRALELFRLAARLDLDDVTGTTAGGLHLATIGGLWQALAYGFLGLRPRGETLDVDPCLPAAWRSLAMRLRFRGRRIGVWADHESVRVDCDGPVSVRIAGGPAQVCEPPGRSVSLETASLESARDTKEEVHR